MISFQSFLNELSKLAATQAEKVEQHHSSEVKDWKSFEKNMKTIGFQKAVLNHPESDAKLRRYVKNVGEHIKSKNVIAVAPSRSSDKKQYNVKQLSSGRWSCDCKDWQYHHSVRKSDCDHVRAVKAMHQQGQVKTSNALIRGAGLALQARKAKKVYQEGKEVSQNLKAIRQPDPNAVTLKDVKELLF